MIAFGEDAIASIIKRAVVHVGGIYEHATPEKVSGVNEYQDVTALSSRQVGQLHQFFINQHAYMLVELAKADQDLVAVEYCHDVLKKQFMLSHDSGKEKWRVDQQAAVDEKIAKAYQSVLEKQAYRDMLSATTKGVEAKAMMLSREMTRRGAEKV